MEILKKRTPIMGAQTPKRRSVMKKVKWIRPALTVLAKENPEKHVLVADSSDDARRSRHSLQAEIRLDGAYALSPAIAAKELEGEIVIVPAGTGAIEDALYALNNTAKALWGHFDGSRTLKDIADDLLSQFEASPSEIEKDVRDFAEELLRKHMLVESA